MILELTYIILQNLLKYQNIQILLFNPIHFIWTKFLIRPKLFNFIPKYLALDDSFILFHPFGNMINSLNRTDSAFVHRGINKPIYYNVNSYIYIWRQNSSENDTNALVLTKEFFNETQLLFGHTESYQNYSKDIIYRLFGKILCRKFTTTC